LLDDPRLPIGNAPGNKRHSTPLLLKELGL
jgi:hypothetical protein